MKNAVAVMLTVFALFLGSAGTVSADTFTLTGVIRDLQDTHPDFERAICGHIPNLVDVGLGLDKKPLYGPLGEDCINSSGSLAQWYVDTPNVNQSTNYSIVLDNGQIDPGGTYTYYNNFFFPIDNQLLGNQGRNHNFHFTYEIHSTFRYMGGETLTIYADDDVWVYIDNILVMDLGGIHQPISGSRGLDTLDLEVGQVYEFDLFYAERHTVDSVLQIQTSIQLGLFFDGFESGDTSAWDDP